MAPAGWLNVFGMCQRRKTNPAGVLSERARGFVSSGDEHIPNTLREGAGAVCPLRPQMCPRLSSDGNFSQRSGFF